MMALKEISPLDKKQWDFVVEKLDKEEKNPTQERLDRIKEAQQNAKKMKVFYH
jgi:hypothetical protein